MTYFHSVHSTVIFQNFLPQIMAVWSMTLKLTILRERKQWFYLLRWQENRKILWNVTYWLKSNRTNFKPHLPIFKCPFQIYVFTRKLWYYKKDWKDPHQTVNNGYLWEESWRRWQEVNENLCFLLSFVSSECIITRTNTYKSLVKSLRRQATTWEKAFANHTSGKGLVSRTYKELQKLRSKKTTQWENRQKIWTDISPNNIYRRQISTWEDAPHH